MARFDQGKVRAPLDELIFSPHAGATIFSTALARRINRWAVDLDRLQTLASILQLQKGDLSILGARHFDMRG
jgi:hypothetical protein